MELATFTLDPSDIAIAGQMRLGSDEAIALVTDVYRAWTGSQNSVTGAPAVHRLKATLRQIEQGASGVEALEVSFSPQQGSDPIAKFVARVHGANMTSVAPSQESALAMVLSRSGQDAICCKILDGQFLNGRAVVYHHAGSDFRRLDDVLASLCETGDDGVFSIFLSEFDRFLRTVTNVYDDFTRAPTALPTPQYLANIAPELPPSLIFDLRGQKPHVSSGLISLLKEPGKRTKPLTPDALVATVSNPKQKPFLSVSVDFSTQRAVQTRYLTLPVTILRGGSNIEMWLIAERELVQSAALSGSTLRIEMLLPCPQLRLATDVLSQCGFTAASVRPRTKYLEFLGSSGPRELRAALRHRDVHPGNVLATSTHLKLVDLGDVNEDLVGVDVCRLEVSLVRKLIDRIGLTLADVHSVIGALSSPLIENLDHRLNRVFQILKTLRDAAEYVRRKHGVGEAEIHLSRLLQTLYYQRYLLSEVVDSPGASRRDSFAAYSGTVLHDYEQAVRRTGTSTGTFIQPEMPIVAGDGHFGQLWTRALSLKRDMVLPEAEGVLNAIRKSVGAAWNNPLTDLQTEIIAGDSNSPDEPFTSSKHVLLYGPTSCGKTTVADAFLLRTALLNVNRRLGLYIAPTRALAQEKYHELRSKLAGTGLADGLVLSTGENLEQDHRILTARFAIAVMVYEKANILFSRNRRALDRLGCVVVDEIHMLEDLERGPMLELALTKIQDNRRRMDRSTDRHDEHLRIIAISTEGADPGSLISFLSATDPDTLTPIPPLVFKGRRRPVPVEHCVVVPSSGQHFDSMPITTITQDSDRILSDDRLLAVARELEAAQSLLSGARHAPAKTDLQTRLFSLLDSRITRLRPKGYRAIVFVPSKTELELLADAYRIRRHATADVLATHTLERLRSAAKSAGEMDTGHRVVLAAAKGVFIHHSEVETGARRLIEELLCETLGPGSSQVVFATETLSYGVNLAVTDVILFGTRFYTSGRRRSLSQVPVSVCAFHNMTGRAGRLGRGGSADASAFVLVTQEANPFNEIVKTYYSEVPTLSSSLLDREDKAVLLAEFERADYGLSGGVSFGQAFTYPFVRSVLDALRHLSVINSPSRALYARVPAEDLHGFLFRTLYAEQRLKHTASPVMDRERDLFKKAVDYTLQDLATFPLNLVDCDTHEGRDYYSITNRGEAIIDTGTEITTLRPLLEIGRRLQATWSAATDGSRFPAALYLLAVVSQTEAYRHVIRCAPEVSDADMSRLPSNEAEANRLLVLERFASALEMMRVRLPEPLTAASLRDVLDEHLTPTGVNDFYGKYEGGLTDAVLRLFAAIAAWSRGAARSDVRRLILGAAGDPIRSTQLSGFGTFRDQASWKLVFLARILGAPDPHAAAVLTTRDEKELYSLAMSVRIGCEWQACRLIFQDYPESLSREEATALVGLGYSGDRIVQHPALAPPSAIPPDRFAALRARLCHEAGERYLSLAGTWTAALGPEPAEADLAKLWDSSAKTFRAAIDCYYGSNTEHAKAEQTIAVQGGWAPIIEGERRQVREAGLADRTVLRFSAGADDLTARWVFESTIDDSRAPEHRLAVKGVQFLSDWSVMTTRGGSGVNEVLPLPADEPVVACVAFPWIPPMDAMPAKLRDALVVRHGRGQRLVFISPAAFMLLLSGVIRAFLPVKDLVEFLVFGATPRDDGICVVGFDHAEEVLLAKGGSGGMPSALRESLMNHYELGFR